MTVRANEAGFSRLTLVPRVLRGIGEPTLEVSLLGCDASAPILLAPTAFHRLAHPEAELATARAAAATGTIMIAAMLSTVAIEDLAAAARTIAAEPGLWFQLYIQPDLGFTEAIVRRAEAAGCRALVVTSDSPVLGRNERNDRNDFHDLPAGLRCENLRELRGGEPGSVRQVSLSPQISWSHLDWLRKTSDLPILVKGILHPEDAKLAVHRGVDALVVSNHGGRQLDTAGHHRPTAADRRGRRRTGSRAARRWHPARDRRCQGARTRGGRRRGRTSGSLGTRGGWRARRGQRAVDAAQRARAHAHPVRRRLAQGPGARPGAGTAMLTRLPQAVVALRMRVFTWVNGDEGIPIPGPLVDADHFVEVYSHPAANGRSRGAALSDLFWYWLAPGPHVHQEHLEAGERYDEVAPPDGSSPGHGRRSPH